MTSVPITLLLYYGPLLCGFNLAIKGINSVGLFVALPQEAIMCDTSFVFLSVCAVY